MGSNMNRIRSPVLDEPPPPSPEHLYFLQVQCNAFNLASCVGQCISTNSLQKVSNLINTLQTVEPVQNVIFVTIRHACRLHQFEQSELTV
jgi:hypothetical protein